MNPDNCNRLQFFVIDYNYKNINPRANRKVRNLYQAIVINYVIDYNCENFRPRTNRKVWDLYQAIVIDYIIDYNCEKKEHHNRKDSKLGTRVLHCGSSLSCSPATS